MAIFGLNPWSFNYFGAENGIFHSNPVNSMATDALAPYVARSSVAMVLTV